MIRDQWEGLVLHCSFHVDVTFVESAPNKHVSYIWRSVSQSISAAAQYVTIMLFCHTFDLLFAVSY